MKSQKKKAKKLNLTLSLVNDNKPWVLKRWDVYSGKFYLGRIYKREIGRGTPIRTGKKTSIAYQCLINLSSREGIGYPQKRIDKITDLKLAKAEFVRLYTKLINSLATDNLIFTQ